MLQSHLKEVFFKKKPSYFKLGEIEFWVIAAVLEKTSLCD